MPSSKSNRAATSKSGKPSTSKAHSSKSGAQPSRKSTTGRSGASQQAQRPVTPTQPATYKRSRTQGPARSQPADSDHEERSDSADDVAVLSVTPGTPGATGLFNPADAVAQLSGAQVIAGLPRSALRPSDQRLTVSQDQSHQTHPVTPRNNQAPQHTWQGLAAGAAANTVSPPPSLSMVTLAPPAPAQPLRRSPRKNPMAIWVLDPILKTAFPAHCKNLSLFTAWSEERRNKEMSRCRQSSQSCTEEAVRAQELDAILSRSSQSPAYAFEIVLGLVPPSLESASSDGALLQLAGRFAGSTYIPKGQSDTVSSVTGLTLKIGTAWRELRPQLFQCVQEVSMSRYNEMVVQITAYFRNRASWAAEDFKYEPGLAPVVQRIQQQAREVTELIAGYGMIVSGGLQSGHVTIAQAHRCWFDLFYPFCKEFGGAPPDEAPIFRQGAALPASSQQWHQQVQQPPSAYAQQGQPQQQFSSQQQHPQPPAANWHHQHQPSLVGQSQQYVPPRPGRPVVRALAPSLGHGALVVGQPMSPGMVGRSLSTVIAPRDSCQYCSGNHYRFECPVALFNRYHEPCPGFDRNGQLIPGAWHNGEITDNTKSAWRSYISRHNVPVCTRGPAAGAHPVNFG